MIPPSLIREGNTLRSQAPSVPTTCPGPVLREAFHAAFFPFTPGASLEPSYLSSQYLGHMLIRTCSPVAPQTDGGQGLLQFGPLLSESGARHSNTPRVPAFKSPLCAIMVSELQIFLEIQKDLHTSGEFLCPQTARSYSESHCPAQSRRHFPLSKSFLSVNELRLLTDSRMDRPHKS